MGINLTAVRFSAFSQEKRQISMREQLEIEAERLLVRSLLGAFEDLPCLAEFDCYTPRLATQPVCASVAQLAEFRFCKPAVVGSTPTASFLDSPRLGISGCCATRVSAI